MARAFLVLLGVSAAALSGTGCGGDTFTATGGAGGTGGGGTTTTATTGGDGGAGGATGGTGGATGGQGGATGGQGGAGGQGGQGGGAACQPLSDECTQCAFAACEDLYCGCYASADCPALVNCLSVCDPADGTCVKPCLSAHKDSISLAFLLGDCAATPCDGTCAGVAQQQACPKCLFEKCSGPMNECLADPDCYDIIQCAAACAPNDVACAFACANGKSMAAQNKAFAVQACTGDAAKCKTECGG